MKFNFKFYIKNCFTNIIKFGKIKSNYFKLKKILKKLNIFLNTFFKKKICLYLIKLKYKKGDRSLIGEIGFFSKIKNIYLK